MEACSFVRHRSGAVWKTVINMVSPKKQTQMLTAEFFIQNNSREQNPLKCLQTDEHIKFGIFLQQSIVQSHRGMKLVHESCGHYAD